MIGTIKHEVTETEPQKRIKELENLARTLYGEKFQLQQTIDEMAKLQGSFLSFFFLSTFSSFLLLSSFSETRFPFSFFFFLSIVL